MPFAYGPKNHWTAAAGCFVQKKNQFGRSSLQVCVIPRPVQHALSKGNFQQHRRQQAESVVQCSLVDDLEEPAKIVSTQTPPFHCKQKNGCDESSRAPHRSF